MPATRCRTALPAWQRMVKTCWAAPGNASWDKAPEKTFRLQKWQEKLGTRGQTEATLRLRLNKSYPLDVLYVLELEVTLHHPVLLSWESPKDIETARLVRSIHLRDLLKVFSFPSWESYLGKNTPWRNQACNLKVPDSKHWSSQDEAGLVLVKSVGRTEKNDKNNFKGARIKWQNNE